MKNKVYVSGGYTREGKTYHDVTIKGEKFENVPNLPKCDDCTSDNCKYYRNCVYKNEGVVRIFDCTKNMLLASMIWNFATGALVIFLAITYYKTLSLGFFKGTSALIVTMVALDIICLAIEKLLQIFRDNYFYHKLKKKKDNEKAIEEQNRLAEESKKIQEQEEADAKDPNRVKIREAEITLAQIETLSVNINFGECNEKVEFCVSRCKEIIEYLKKDSSGYIRVESLLQVYLPEFYRILVFYSELKNEKAETVEEIYTKKLNNTVNYFYKLLYNQEIEVIFDKKSTEKNFIAAADMFRREIEIRGGKL